METRSAPQRDHESSIKTQKALTLYPDRAQKDRGADTHKSVRPTLATDHAASLARTNACNAIATETEIDFPVRGWANAGLTTPNLRFFWLAFGHLRGPIFIESGSENGAKKWGGLKID